MRRFAALAAAALVLAPAATAATKGPVFGLRAGGNPKLGYFVYTIAPGASRTGAIIVSNSGTAAGTVKLFTSDATTGHTTGTVYLTDQKASRAGSWVKLAQTQVTLAPGAHKSVPFTVKVPQGTKPGQWVGGIVAETSHRVAGTTTSKSKASVQIRIRDLTIVAVQANVPGQKLVSFQIGDVKTGGQRGFQQLIVHFANTGNQLRKPTGRVIVRDSKGAVVQTLPFTMDTFLPQTSIDYPILLKKALGPGTYSTDVSLDTTGPTGAKSHFSASPQLVVSNTDVKQVFTSAQPTQTPIGSSSSSSSTPWLLIAVAVLVLVLVILLTLLLLRRRRGGAEEVAPVAAPAEPFVLRATEPPPLPTPVAEPEPEPAHEEERVEPPPPVAPPRPACDHYWEVAYNEGRLGPDGVWRFPHRCRNCGVETLAADVDDATAQASR